MTTKTKAEERAADPKQPTVTGSPDAIWLVYGDLEHDDTHANCTREGEVLWCEDQQFAADVKYVRADRLAGVEAERDALRARLDRAINAAVEHFGESAIRYKFTLTKSGRVMQNFPRHMDGHWYALQRADDDAHVGLSLRCAEAEAERDDYLTETRTLVRQNGEWQEKFDRLAAEVEALREDAERYRWLRNDAWGCNNKRGPHLVEFKPGHMPSAFTLLAEDAADAAIDAARAKG